MNGYATQFFVSAKTYADPVGLAAKQRQEVMAAVGSGHMVDTATPDVVDAPMVQEPWATEDENEEPRFRAAKPGEAPTHWARTLTFSRAEPAPQDTVLAPMEEAIYAYLDDDTDTSSWDQPRWLADALARVDSPAGVYALLPQHAQALVDEVKRTAVDDRPHSRACGVIPHAHGTGCSTNCPTCGVGARS